MKYTTIKPNQILRNGDEYQGKDYNPRGFLNWHPTGRVGLPAGVEDTYRRPVKAKAKPAAAKPARKRYRALAAGEIIRKGDQFRSVTARPGKWVPSTCPGCAIGSHGSHELKYRRLIRPAKKSAAKARK